MKKWIILDWAGNDVFNGKKFRTISSASDYLIEQVGILYPELKDNEFLFNEQLNEYQIKDV